MLRIRVCHPLAIDNQAILIAAARKREVDRPFATAEASQFNRVPTVEVARDANFARRWMHHFDMHWLRLRTPAVILDWNERLLCRAAPGFRVLPTHCRLAH